jgi:hypothetical protein
MKKRKKEKSRKILGAFVIGGLVSAAVIVFSFMGVFSFLEYKTYDLRVTLLGEFVRPSEDIIVILLNQDSLDWANRERGWAWPWPRKAYAEIVDYMREGGARSIAFDVIFSEPSVYRNARQDEIIDTAVASLEQIGISETSPRENDRQSRMRTGAVMRNIISALRNLGSHVDDASFAQAERDFGRTVQTVVFSSQTGSAESWPADLDKPLFELENFEPILSQYTQLNRNTGGGRMLAQFPIEELRTPPGRSVTYPGGPTRTASSAGPTSLPSSTERRFLASPPLPCWRRAMTTVSATITQKNSSSGENTAFPLTNTAEASSGSGVAWTAIFPTGLTRFCGAPKPGRRLWTRETPRCRETTIFRRRISRENTFFLAITPRAFLTPPAPR